MADRDMRPNRWGLTLEHARVFVAEWYDQNPLGQMAVVGMRAGLGERICSMTSKSRRTLPHFYEEWTLIDLVFQAACKTCSSRYPKSINSNRLESQVYRMRLRWRGVR